MVKEYREQRWHVSVFAASLFVTGVAGYPCSQIEASMFSFVFSDDLYGFGNMARLWSREDEKEIQLFTFKKKINACFISSFDKCWNIIFVFPTDF